MGFPTEMGIPREWEQITQLGTGRNGYGKSHFWSSLQSYRASIVTPSAATVFPCSDVSGPPKDWRRRTDRSRQTGLRTVEPVTTVLARRVQDR